MDGNEEHITSLNYADGLIKKLKSENKYLLLFKELSELQDRLLVCYRVGKNPGTIIDKLTAVKAKIAKGEAS